MLPATVQPNQAGVMYLQVQQTSPEEVWTIAHNFGTYPLVEVLALYEGVMQDALPEEVAHTDENTVTITWSLPMAGVVTCVCPAPLATS